MAYNITALEDYVLENNLPLLKKSLFGSRTAELLQKQTGIKTAAALNLFDTDVVFQDGACSFTPTGSTEFTQRELRVGDISVQEGLCPRELEKKWTQHEVTAGSSPESLPFEQMFTERKAERVAKRLEKAIWQGDTASNDGNLNKFDGLVKHISGSGAAIVVTEATSSASRYVKGEVEPAIDAVYEAIPSDVIDGNEVRIFVSDTVYRLYTQEMRDNNYFHYTPEGDAREMAYPGDSRVIITPVNGLNGTFPDVIIAGNPDHMFIGVDLEGEDEDFELWWSQDNRQVRFAMDFKYGTQVAFPEQIVYKESKPGAI